MVVILSGTIFSFPWFHQHFTSSFFEQKCCQQFFALAVCVYIFLAKGNWQKKLLVKCWWKWLKDPRFSFDIWRHYVERTLLLSWSSLIRIQNINLPEELSFTIPRGMSTSTMSVINKLFISYFTIWKNKKGEIRWSSSKCNSGHMFSAESTILSEKLGDKNKPFHIIIFTIRTCIVINH